MEIRTAIFSFLLMALDVIIPSVCQAQFSFQTYRNRNSSNFSLLDSSRDANAIELSPAYASAVYQYFYNPVGYVQGQAGTGALVANLNSLNFASEYSVSNKLALGLDMPIDELVYYQKGPTFALGDLRLFSRIELGDHFFGGETRLSVVPSLYVPTGNGSLLLSDPHGGLGENLALEKNWRGLLVAANLGLDYFPNAYFGGVSYDVQVYAGIGAKKKFPGPWSAQIEFIERQIHYLSTGDLYVGAEYQFERGPTLFSGVSLASAQFDPADLEYRIFLGLRWAPLAEKVVTQYVRTKVETTKKSTVIHDCGPKPYTGHLLARELTEDEKQGFRDEKKLPYLTTSAHPIQTLRLGGKNGLSPVGAPLVRGAQVLFAFDLDSLPQRSTVAAVKNLDLSMTINKFWGGAEENTDMICFIEEKICSGDLYGQKSMAENINFKFFAGKEPPNDFFVHQLLAFRHGAGETAVMHAQIRLPLQRLIENSILADPMDLVYTAGAGSRASNTKKLYFAVAHDVYVYKDAQLNVELEVESCTDTVNPSVEVRQETDIDDGQGKGVSP